MVCLHEMQPMTSRDDPVPFTDEPVVRGAISFRDFYMREFPVMVALAHSISGSRAAAEDLAQEAMIRAHRDWDTVGAYDKPGAWLRRVTINLSSSFVRRRAIEARARLRMAADRLEALPPEPRDEDRIWKAVRSLPGKQRAAVALHYLEDLDIEEIAEVLECAPSTARVHLHRGRQKLAKLLDDQRISP